MYIKLQQVLNLSFGLSNNPEGFPAEQMFQPMTIAYALYLREFDKIPALRQKRLKTIQVQSTGLGVDVGSLGIKKTETYNDFLVPYDVYESDSTGSTIVNEVFPVENPLSKEKGYFCSGNKIYFTGYTAVSWFRVRYLPEILPFASENYNNVGEAEVYIAQKHLPRWAKFINAIQANIEEETIPLDQLEFEFDKYFYGMAYDIQGSERTPAFNVTTDLNV